MTDHKINVLAAEVWWGDGYENAPSVSFRVHREPVWEVYDKRPGGARGQLSSEQESVVGRPLSTQSQPGWSVYWSEDDGFVNFFTWGGKPDDGFGGSRRVVKLLDGSEETIVGGWHVSPSVALGAGFPSVVDTAYKVPRYTNFGVACFVTVERLEREVAAHLPDVELVDGVPRWRGQPSKAEFMEVERGRRGALQDVLKVKYDDGTWHNSHWYRRASDDERAELKCRPYSALGPTGEAEAPGIRTRCTP